MFPNVRSLFMKLMSTERRTHASEPRAIAKKQLAEAARIEGDVHDILSSNGAREFAAAETVDHRPLAGERGEFGPFRRRAIAGLDQRRR